MAILILENDSREASWEESVGATLRDEGQMLGWHYLSLYLAQRSCYIPGRELRSWRSRHQRRAASVVSLQVACVDVTVFKQQQCSVPSSRAASIKK